MFIPPLFIVLISVYHDSPHNNESCGTRNFYAASNYFWYSIMDCKFDHFLVWGSDGFRNKETSILKRPNSNGWVFSVKLIKMFSRNYVFKFNYRKQLEKKVKMDKNVLSFQVFESSLFVSFYFNQRRNQPPQMFSKQGVFSGIIYSFRIR